MIILNKSHHLLHETMVKMKHFTKPSCIALYGVEDDDYGVLIGSGTLIYHKGSHYILSAGHVLKKIEKKYNGRGAYSFGSTPREFTCSAQYSSNILDIAIQKLSIFNPIGRTETPVDFTFIDPTYALGIDYDYLFIHGWPGEKSRFSMFGNPAIYSESLPFTSFTGKSTLSIYNKSYHFALDYPQSGIDENGDTVDLPSPNGLSGAAVWRTLRLQTRGRWQAPLSRIVGVLHRHDKKSHSLVATNVVEVKRFFDRATLMG